jgi:EAL domain-containing protein (putative c-di-GMP-specific phosphodiesterase class I)
MHDEVTSRLKLENDLRHAAARGQLRLYYQPIVCLTNGRVEGLEALVRWKHPQRGLLSPEAFIECAEETGLIVELGDWVLREACRQLRDWQTKFASLGELTMSVNLATKQLSSPNLIASVQRAIGESGIDPRTLWLELTESTAIENRELTVDVLTRLRAVGVRLAMDNFGTGYSSLNCLHQFPLDCLKIDRDFIRNLGERRDYAAVVHAVIALARNLGLKLVAEGIETGDQAAMLQAMECESAQGFLFDQPLDGPEMEMTLEQSATLSPFMRITPTPNAA